MKDQPNLLGAYLFVRDLESSLAFYAMLGLQVERVSKVFARAATANGPLIELGTRELTSSYDPHWQEPRGPATNTLNFELPSRAAVDALYAKLVGAGYRGHLPPCDPPWQARFAIVDDPDGNVVGLHSPRDRRGERERERARANG
jgi:uncharacterized glyoxalase superfamily protein PhnB